MDQKLISEAVNQLAKIAEGVSSPWNQIVPAFTIISSIAALVAAFAAWKTVSQVKETEKDRLLPIITIDEGGNLYTNGQLYFRIRNIGEGVAKDIYVYIQKQLVEENFNLKKGDYRDIKQDNNAKIATFVKKNSPQIIKASIEYKDVHERKFETIDIEFFLQDNIYCLDRGRWKFIRYQPIKYFFKHLEENFEGWRKNIMGSLKPKYDNKNN